MYTVVCDNTDVTPAEDFTAYEDALARLREIAATPLFTARLYEGRTLLLTTAEVRSED